RRLTLPGADDLVIQLTPTQAIGARDALARALFELAFHWLVKGINRGLGGLVDNSPFIGLLDVFGFEDFALNSFEQLCINFANERLQQLLVERLFKAEIKLYTSEGVPVPGGAGSNSYADNLG
ncbi:P-loop containing nucleoside triphosphate hydrolase protein, partial [Pavlovales sp. CCMP2436]